MNLNPPLRWRTPPLVHITLALHALVLATVFIYPSLWKWAVATLLANHAVLTAVGLWPRSTWLGPNWTRLPAVCSKQRQIALTIDDGPDPQVTPKVLDLLERYGVKATFFCIGEKAALHPQLCKAMVERGHAVENHSQHHRHHFSLLGFAGMAREIHTAQLTLASVTGRPPLFFRAPAGLRNPFLDPVLARLGLRLAAWTRRGFDTRTRDPETVTRRLLQDLQPGAILLLHDGNCARTASGEPVILAVLPALIKAARERDLQFITLPTALNAAHHDSTVH